MSEVSVSSVYAVVLRDLERHAEDLSPTQLGRLAATWVSRGLVTVDAAHRATYADECLTIVPTLTPRKQ